MIFEIFFSFPGIGLAVAEDAGWKRVVMFPSSEGEVMLADYDADGRYIDELGDVVKMVNEFFVAQRSI